MKPNRRERLAFWLERFGWIHRILLRYDGEAPDGRDRYVNRLNGHVVSQQRPANPPDSENA